MLISKGWPEWSTGPNAVRSNQGLLLQGRLSAPEPVALQLTGDPQWDIAPGTAVGGSP